LLPIAVQNLLDAPVSAVVSTVGPDGHPQSSVVWIERVGDNLAFFSDANSKKITNIRQRPNVVVIVVDDAHEFEPGARCYVRLTGTADVSQLSDSALPDRLARRYMGIDAYPQHGDYVRADITTTSWSGIGPFPDTPNGWGP
jgi:PPOX class probable F420-dependent enzyme